MHALTQDRVAISVPAKNKLTGWLTAWLIMPFPASKKIIPKQRRNKILKTVVWWDKLLRNCKCTHDYSIHWLDVIMTLWTIAWGYNSPDDYSRRSCTDNSINSSQHYDWNTQQRNEPIGERWWAHWCFTGDLKQGRWRLYYIEHSNF